MYDGWDQARRNHGRGGDLQTLPDGRFSTFDSVTQRMDLADDALCHWLHPLARIGQRHSARCSVEQARTDLLLQLLHQHAHSGR